jgi:phage shock protein A
MEKEIQKSNNTIENLELDIKSLEAKIERLEQRKRDLKYFN